MERIQDIDYLFISSRVRALESGLLTRERMARMLEAPSAEDAAKVLLECGYPEMSPLDGETIRSVLASEHHKVVTELSTMVPDPSIIDVFKVKYDYHNVKVILKSEAMGTDPLPLLMNMGRVPAKELLEKISSSDLRGIPAILQEAIGKAKETLGTTRDPQLSDLVLDSAYFQDMFLIAQKAESRFLEGYVRICIDAANLRTAVRTLRMGKSSDFLRDILFSGGNMYPYRVLNAASAGGSLAELFAMSPLKEAAEAGAAAISGGRMTIFEKLCDNALTEYLRGAKYVPFGEAPVISYVAAKESEFTAVRILLTGRMSNIPAEIIQERLRESYV